MQNESPILGPFLDQIDAFFDQCVLLDHQSSDNSISLVQKRDSSRYKTCFLKSSGYPQSEVATWYAHSLLSNGESDFLFFLDCDEFLPFENRRELEGFLTKNIESDIITLHWLNVYPESFEGGDIFSNKFYHSAPSSYLKKVILNKSIVKRSANFIIDQGYHRVLAPDASYLDTADIKDRFLIHIPIQSLVKFSFKVANGNNRILHDDGNKKLRLGAHWIDMAQQLAINGLDRAYMENIVLRYSEPDNESPLIRRKLHFTFPYVKSPYAETPAYISSQIASLVHYDMQLGQSAVSRSFSVADASGNILFTDKTMPAEYLLPSKRKTEEDNTPAAGPSDNPPELSKMIESLFDLPLMTPRSSKEGYLHFLPVLLKMLRPRSYVLLGSGFRASLAALSAAVAEYGLETKVYCIDASQEDLPGADAAAADIRDMNTVPLSETPLAERLTLPLSKALEHFKNGSVDILHFEDLGESPDSKNTITKWFNALSPHGIIVFQNIYASSVIRPYWEELKQSFFSLEFRPMEGLGILFLDPDDARIAPLLALAKDGKAFAIYSEFVYCMAKAYGRYENRIASKQSDIKQLKEILQKYQSEIALRLSDVKELKSGMDAMQSTVSWKITAPLRASKDLVRRFKSEQAKDGLEKNTAGPDCGLLPCEGADPKAIFINISGGNAGDLLISRGCKSFLYDMGVEFSETDSRLADAALAGDNETVRRSLENYRGTIFFNGGGNVGIYRENETVRASIIQNAKRAKGILVFPQSCFRAEDALKASNVTVWARERQSYEILKSAGIHAELVPDAAFYMEDAIPKRPEGTGCFYIRRAPGRCLERSAFPFQIGCPSADLTFDRPIQDIIETLLPYQTVVSDRLHGAIFSILMRKRTALLPVGYHKNQSFYDTWLKDDPGVGFIQNQEDLERFFQGSGIPAISPKELFFKYAAPAFNLFLNRK